MEGNADQTTIVSKGSLVRKLPYTKSRVRHAKHVKGTPVQRAVSPRSRHGLGMLPTAMFTQTFSEVHFARKAQHFGRLRCRFRGRRSILWPCKVGYRFRGRRSTFARSSTDFVAGAPLSQGRVIN